MRVQPKAGGMLVETPKPQQMSDFHGHRIRQLQVRGVHIGSLVQIAEECNVGNNAFLFSQWQETARLAGVRVEVDWPRIDYFSSLITHGLISGPTAIRSAISLIISWEKEKENTVPLCRITSSLAPSHDIQAQIVLDHCDDGKFAVLDSGYIALVPIYTEVSDMVYVLPGASVPFVFRKQNDHFVLVGECYVQGITHGEALENSGMSAMELLGLE
jgi:hypothetical protein